MEQQAPLDLPHPLLVDLQAQLEGLVGLVEQQARYEMALLVECSFLARAPTPVMLPRIGSALQWD